VTIMAPVGRDFPAQIATGEHGHRHNEDDQCQNEDDQCHNEDDQCHDEDGQCHNEDGHCHNEDEDNTRLDEPFSIAHF